MNNNDNAVESKCKDINRCANELEDKQFQLCDAAVENKELQWELQNASKTVEDTVRKHEIVENKLSENFNAFWNEYQDKKIELMKAQSCTECLNVKLDVLDKTREDLECRKKELTEKRIHLEKENVELNAILADNNNIICKLKNENYNQFQCLDRNTEELDRTNSVLVEKTVELKEHKKESCELKSRLTCLETALKNKVERLKESEMLLMNDNDVLHTELQTQQNRKSELNRCLDEHKCKLQELRVALEKSNEQINELKRTLEKERCRTGRCIDKLLRDKLHAVKEKEKFENKN